MWVCWYGNDLNKQESFPSGKNNFSSCSFSFFFTFVSKQHQRPLSLQVQSHGRRGRDEVSLSMSHWCVCSACGNLNRRSETRGWLLWGDHEGCLAPRPRPLDVAGSRGRPGGEAELWGDDDALGLPPCWAVMVMIPCPARWEEDDPFCWKVLSELWILAGFYKSVFSWNFKWKCSQVKEVFLKTAVFFQEELDWEHSKFLYYF